MNALSAMPLTRQFLLAGSVIMTATMLIVGQWIVSRIEQAVVQNSGAAAALYMDSFISPLSQDLANSESLPEPARRALSETISGTALGQQLVSFKIWKQGGLVVEASDPSIVGHVFDVSGDLAQAWEGRFSAAFEDVDKPESAAEKEMGIPLLEVYSPIREAWSGEIIAVAEYYMLADALAGELRIVRLQTWLLVAGAFLTSAVALYGIVLNGSRTIERQRALLERSVARANDVAEQNAALRERVVNASSRAAERFERRLRQIGSELHDGPAQYMAMASMRLGDVEEGGAAETGAIADALSRALAEIRSISRGLAHPELEDQDLPTIVADAVEAQRLLSGREITLDIGGCHPVPSDYSTKLCLFRFLQEGLSNAVRYAPGADIRVAVATTDDDLLGSIEDDGPGLSGAQGHTGGGQGLVGMRDRIESLGGRFSATSLEPNGTRLTFSLPLETEIQP